MIVYVSFANIHILYNITKLYPIFFIYILSEHRFGVILGKTLHHLLYIKKNPKESYFLGSCNVVLNVEC